MQAGRQALPAGCPHLHKGGSLGGTVSFPRANPSARPHCEDLRCPPQHGHPPHPAPHSEAGDKSNDSSFLLGTQGVAAGGGGICLSEL